MKKLNCILLIDDDEATNYYNQIIIRKLNCTDKIVVKESGFEALEYLKSKEEDGNYPCPDLIFLDINMPAMNGWEFLEQYKKLEATQRGRIVVVMLTTSLNPADQEMASRLNEIQDFVNKPLGIELVQNILSKHFK